MIIIDTNVISELMKPSPSLNVITWIDQQEPNKLFVTSITIAEISFGLNVLPNGKRKISLEAEFDVAIVEAFEHRILSFDQTAAHLYGRVMGHIKKIGKPLSVLDGQIAAIALATNSAIATRNIRDFARCGIDLVNPFEIN